MVSTVFSDETVRLNDAAKKKCGAQKEMDMARLEPASPVRPYGTSGHKSLVRSMTSVYGRLTIRLHTL